MAGVKVIDETFGVPSPLFELEIGIVTSPVGWLVRTTVKVAVPPPSDVGPEIGLTVKPALLTSVFVTGTSAGVVLL